MSTLIPRVSAAVADEQPEAPAIRPAIVVPVTKAVTIPLDVANAIQREAARDPSDPYIARRLAAHYRSGIWSPADSKAK
jgi:hypothetical protein